MTRIPLKGGIANIVLKLLSGNYDTKKSKLYVVLVFNYFNILKKK